MVERQRELIGAGDWVAEGRDIGTVVAPGRRVSRSSSTAVAPERARRRAGDERAQPPDDVLAEQEARDARDSGRESVPAGPPRQDAVAARHERR